MLCSTYISFSEQGGESVYNFFCNLVLEMYGKFYFQWGICCRILYFTAVDFCSSLPTLYILYFEVYYLFLLNECVFLILKFDGKSANDKVKYSDARWVFTFHFYLEDSLITPLCANISMPIAICRRPEFKWHCVRTDTIT